jgi:hypothetical protein
MYSIAQVKYIEKWTGDGVLAVLSWCTIDHPTKETAFRLISEVTRKGSQIQTNLDALLFPVTLFLVVVVVVFVLIILITI